MSTFLSNPTDRRPTTTATSDGVSSIVNVLDACRVDLSVDLLWSVDALAGVNVACTLPVLERQGLVSISMGRIVSITSEGQQQASLMDHGDRARLRSSVGRAAAGTGCLPAKLIAELRIDGLVVDPDDRVIPELIDDAERHLREGCFDDAVDVLRAVVAAIQVGHPVSDRTRRLAYLRLSLVLRWSGHIDEAERLAHCAEDAARLSGKPSDLALAGLMWRPYDPASSRRCVGALIDEALIGIDHDDVQMRSMLLAARAEANAHTDPRAAQHAAVEALGLARRVGDPETLIRAANAFRSTHDHPARHAEMLSLSREMVAVAPGAIDGRESGTIARLHTCFELGDFTHFDSDLHALWRRIRRQPHPLELLSAHLMSAGRAQTRGDWDRADSHVAAAEDLMLGSARGCANSTQHQMLVDQRAIGAWQRGVQPMTPDDIASARTADSLDRLLVEGMSSINGDPRFGPVVASLTLAVVEARSIRHARILFDAMSLFSGQWAGAGGAATFGPYDYYLGELAALLDRRTEAMTFLNRALANCIQHGCDPWEARVRLAIARSADTDDMRRDQATAALAVAGRLDMSGVVDDARMFLESIDNPAGLTDREIEVLMLVVAGGTNRGIADGLRLSVKTVERHLLNSYRKVGAANRAEASAFAVRQLKHCA
jgi:DNA-binding CsgD family transcriptional regulator